MYIFTNELDRHLHHCEVTHCSGPLLACRRRVCGGGFLRVTARSNANMNICARRRNACQQTAAHPRVKTRWKHMVFIYFYIYNDFLQVGGTSELRLEASGIAEEWKVKMQKRRRKRLTAGREIQAQPLNGRVDSGSLGLPTWPSCYQSIPTRGELTARLMPCFLDSQENPEAAMMVPPDSFRLQKMQKANTKNELTHAKTKVHWFTEQNTKFYRSLFHSHSSKQCIDTHSLHMHFVDWNKTCFMIVFLLFGCPMKLDVCWCLHWPGHTCKRGLDLNVCLFFIGLHDTQCATM